jgi:hypothetical protein
VWNSQWNDWQRKRKYSKKTAPEPLCPLRIPHYLTRARTPAVALENQRLPDFRTYILREKTVKFYQHVQGNIKFYQNYSINCNTNAHFAPFFQLENSSASYIPIAIKYSVWRSGHLRIRNKPSSPSSQPYRTLIDFVPNSVNPSISRHQQICPWLSEAQLEHLLSIRIHIFYTSTHVLHRMVISYSSFFFLSSN